MFKALCKCITMPAILCNEDRNFCWILFVVCFLCSGTFHIFIFSGRQRGGGWNVPELTLAHYKMLLFLLKVHLENIDLLRLKSDHLQMTSPSPVCHYWNVNCLSVSLTLIITSDHCPGPHQCRVGSQKWWCNIIYLVASYNERGSFRRDTEHHFRPDSNLCKHNKCHTY